MLQRLAFVFLMFFCVLFTRAQKFTVSGNIADTTTRANLTNAVASVLRLKDSVLVKYQRITNGKTFTINNLDTGKYVLLVTHPAFADFVDVITVEKNYDAGTIQMLSKAMVLQDVIVRGSPIRMKGDTLSYVADSFKVKEGATVEDLLKRLPGIQVNSKGEITAQGEKVQKVLVDGEEFFGDDPTLATQNMIAKAVKEVQVFDKKSEQSTFTGVDDGEKTKTINLKLKDEFKKGYFGKLELGGGLPDRWENSAMINAFRDKRKLSVYGKMGNTNQTGLGWREDSQYGGNMSSQTEMTDDGGMMMWSSGDEFGGIGSYGGEGLPKSWMAGTSYSNKFNDKNSLNGAYRYQKMNTQGTTTTSTQTILPDTQYFNNQVAQTQASRWRQKANLKSDITIDSSQSLTITADGSYGKSFTSSLISSEALTGSKVPVNKNDRTTFTDATTASFNAAILYKKKFKKKGRTFSLNLSEKYNSNIGDGFLVSRLQLFDKGSYQKTDSIDQKKENDMTGLTVDSRAAYTEPIGKNGVIELNYGYGISNSEQKRLSYDKINGKYDALNDLFSNDYKFNIGTHKAGAGYRYSYKKVTLGIGSDMTLSQWKQTDLFKDSTRKYNFNNFFPRANFGYKLGQYSRVSFNYSGSTQAPSINQIQPVANNEDPLNIAIGNPDIKQSFRNHFQLSYNLYQVLKEQGVWANLSYNPVSNDFSSYDIIDTTGKRTYKTVNVNGNYSLNSYLNYFFTLKKSQLRFNVSFNPTLRRNVNFVNGLRNETKNRELGFGVSVSKFKDKKYDISIGIDAAHNYSTSSIRKDVVTKYWTASPNVNFNFQLPKDIEFGTDFNYNWRQKTEVFNNNNNIFLWNAFINKKVMKKQNLRLGVKVNDILNQNIGFRRDVSTNYITERTYNTIRRFWMATLTWNFNKGPKTGDEW